MDRLADAAKVFQEAFDECDEKDSLRPRILTNLAAALVKSQQYDAVISLAQKHASIVKRCGSILFRPSNPSLKSLILLNRAYDLAYNVACAYLEKGNIDLADQYLDVAQGPFSPC